MESVGPALVHPPHLIEEISGFRYKRGIHKTVILVRSRQLPEQAVQSRDQLVFLYGIKRYSNIGWNGDRLRLRATHQTRSKGNEEGKKGLRHRNGFVDELSEFIANLEGLLQSIRYVKKLFQDSLA